MLTKEAIEALMRLHHEKTNYLFIGEPILG
jgi:hypothetical protein